MPSFDEDLSKFALLVLYGCAVLLWPTEAALNFIILIQKNENDSVPGIRDDGCEFWIVMNVESLHLCSLIVFECIFADNLEVG